MATQQQQRTTSSRASQPGSTQRLWWHVDMRSLWRQARKTLKGQFLVLAISMIILAVLVALLISPAFRQAYTDLDTIGNGSVPSVDAAQAMSQYLEDIDAKAADYLAAAGLTNLEPCTLPGSSRNPGMLTVHDCDNLTINAEITLANDELYQAAHNVTYPGERTAIERITAGFEEYVGDISLMRYEYGLAASKTDPRDVHLQNARAAYLMANSVLLTRITQQPILDATNSPVFNEPNVPSCTISPIPTIPGRVLAPNEWPLSSLQDNIDCLSSINKAHLDAAYDDTVNFLAVGLALAIFSCLVFCLLLGVTTWRMAVMTHRFINIGLALALLVGVVFSISVVTNFATMTGRHGVFGQLVKDDYDSIYFAALLKRYATAANADESRWLIALDFNDRAGVDHWYQDWLDNTARVRTLIANAKANRTYPQEDQPLADMQQYWDSYSTIDSQLRAKALDMTNPSRILDAEGISTGISNQSFGNFTQAVDNLSAANRSYYDRTFADTTGSLTLYIALSAILFPLIGLAGAWGISRRFKDF